MNVEQLIKGLEKEIKLSTDEQWKNESLIRLQRIAETYNGDDKVVSSHELWEEIKNRPPEKKMMSGFTGLDKILDGFRKKQLVVLSGITKHGKTALAVELSTKMESENPLWITLEEPAEDIITKFVERNEAVPLFYTPRQSENYNLDWIEKKIVESIAKHNTQVTFIDHLGFITHREPAESQEQATARTVRYMKTLAKKWDIVIVLLAHLVKVDIDTHPNLQDLKDSSAIAQEADTVMFIWRATKKKRKTKEVIISNHAYLSVQANRRNGRTGYVKLVFEDGRYKEKDWDEDLIWGEHEGEVNDDF